MNLAAYKMKYYIADIVENNGEFEHITTIRFSISENEDAVEKHKYHASSWYSDLERNEFGWWTTCGTVAVNRGKLTEIDHDTFQALADHLVCL